MCPLHTPNVITELCNPLQQPLGMFCYRSTGVTSEKNSNDSKKLKLLDINCRRNAVIKKREITFSFEMGEFCLRLVWCSRFVHQKV